jgi:hypothetical protein
MYVSKLSRLIIVVILLAFSALACGFPGVTSEVAQDSDAVVASRVAATMAADLVAEVPGGAALPPDSSEASQPLETTPTITQTPTETLTPMPSIPMVSVTVNTNCRFGPGQAYEYLGALLEGETAEIYGRDPWGNFWYIENPDRPGSYCWITAAYAQVSGDTSQVPELTPPPTPTNTTVPFIFTISMPISLECAQYYITFAIQNGGPQTIESVSIHVEDLDTGQQRTRSDDALSATPSCVTAALPALVPGEMGHLIVGPYSYDPQGHNVQTTVRVCSENGLGGSCTEKALTQVAVGSPVSISDAALKENRGPVDAKEVLDHLLSVPIETWNYIGDSDRNRHMGPMAQDFFAAYGLGVDDRLNAIDVQGVALASIQALHEIVEEDAAQIVELEARLAELEAQVAMEAPDSPDDLYFVLGFLVGASLVVAIGWIWRRRRFKDT